MARKTREEAMETREKLLESALEVMSEKPFSKVSMNEIAERIGLSKGAVYWHFKNKDDLLINLVEAICGEGKDDLGARGADFDSWNDLRLYFCGEMKKSIANDRYKRLSMLMQRKVEWPRDVQERIFSLGRAWDKTERNMVENVMGKMLAGGAVREDVRTDEIAALITAIFRGLMISQFLGFFSMDIEKQVSFIFDSFSEQLRPGKADI
ncbi:MAG: TetR family transcriptional regulator [Synergistaceae bacterium]|jgi:TetR/AcrR family acrAB operon transcriptional repressor|nr:TetR family transcriptional regulator [Synergistaceae bacterium]